MLLTFLAGLAVQEGHQPVVVLGKLQGYSEILVLAITVNVNTPTNSTAPNNPAVNLKTCGSNQGATHHQGRVHSGEWIKFESVFCRTERTHEAVV